MIEINNTNQLPKGLVICIYNSVDAKDIDRAGVTVYHTPGRAGQFFISAADMGAAVAALKQAKP